MYRSAAGFASGVSAHQEHATVIGFRGDLGSGKTTFAQGVARALGVEEQVTSPTFVIQKSYTLPKEVRGFARLVHMDAYRIETLDELRPLKFQELLKDPKTLLIIEWPDKVRDALPEYTKYVDFEYVLNEGRTVSYDHGQ